MCFVHVNGVLAKMRLSLREMHYNMVRCWRVFRVCFGIHTTVQSLVGGWCCVHEGFRPGEYTGTGIRVY